MQSKIFQEPFLSNNQDQALISMLVPIDIWEDYSDICLEFFQMYQVHSYYLFHPSQEPNTFYPFPFQDLKKSEILV